MMNQFTIAETGDSAWKPLYKVGGISALLVVAMIPIQAIIFLGWPPPGFLPNISNVSNWFTLFRENWFLGLLELDLLLIADYAITGLVFLSLYIALKQANKTFTAIALTLCLVGIADYIASNPAFAMLTLSDQYATAGTDAQRSMFLGAGQALLAMYQGSPFFMSFVLQSVAALIISVVMLRSNIFSKATAYVGILGSATAILIGPPWPFFEPAIGALLSLISVVVFAIWYILVALRLFQLGSGVLRQKAE